MTQCHFYQYVIRFTRTLSLVLGLGHLLCWRSLTAHGRLFIKSNKMNANIATNCREETLSAAREWVEKLRSSNSSNIRGVLLAAKANIFSLSVCEETFQADLGDRRVVSPKAGAELAASLGLQYFESSAKDQTGVEVRILQNP